MYQELNLKRYVSPFELYMRILCLFPVFTVLNNEGVSNKLLFGIVAVLQIYMLINRPMKRKTFVLIIIMGVTYVYALMHTDFPMSNMNLLFYYPFTIIYTYFVIDYRNEFIKWLIKSKRYVRLIIQVWTIIVGVSILLPSSYYMKEAGSFYFGSFCGTIFRLGPAAVFIQALILVSISMYKKRKDIIYMVVPMYCYFMGSSRTYLIVGLCLFVIGWYWYGTSKKVFLLTAIPLFVVVTFVTMNSSLGNKIIYTLDDNQYGDFWFRVTSSRSLIWERNIYAWEQEPLLNKLLGSGIEFTIKINKLWAHNDFIELMCSFGLVGVIQYIVSLFRMMTNLYGKNKIPLLIIISAFVSWLFNAFFNMHYVYFCCLLGYPFALLAIGYYYSNKLN